MKIAIGSDHAGFLLKEIVKDYLLAKKFQVIDMGTHSADMVDYPDFALKVADEVVKNCERGILICGSGVGVNIAANKVRGIRASVCHDTYSARQGVEHDDMNILVLGARIVGEALALELVKTFLSATFCNDERHVRRVDKIKAIEKREA
jgi:RpiB/LacA/LacB family sugar-phosphate isomerase